MSTFAQLVYGLIGLANNTLVPILYILALIFFLIGMVRFFFAAPSDENRTSAKKMMIYGLIGLVVLFAVWGLVNLVINTFLSAANGATG